MTATIESTTRSHAGRLRRAADLAYGWLLGGFVLALLAQVYLAGVGAFGDADRPHSDAFGPHETLGNILGVVAIVLFLLSLAARLSRRVAVASLLLALLVELAQHALADAGHDDRWVGGLHAFDGFLILGIAVWLLAGWHRRTAAR